MLGMRECQKAKEYLQGQRAKAVSGGCVVTRLGRYRRFPLVTEKTRNEQQNQASNMEIQSLASDCTLMSAISINFYKRHGHRTFKEANIINIVHDSILFEVSNGIPPSSMALEIQNLMCKIPTQHLDTDVKFEVDFKTGKRWGDMKELKL